MIFSHTQISQYVRCPRSYRYRHLDGWQEKENRAGMVFGRAFEKALYAYFSNEDPGAALFKEWGVYRDTPFEYKTGESWDRFVHQGIHLLQKFAQDDRVHVARPKKNMQVKLVRALLGNHEFVAYIDALGELDGTRCVMDWKTTASRYPEEPEGLLALDPQLICYSWITGIPEVALVVFVRKNHPKIQYLRATISEEQRKEYGRLVETTVAQIEAGQFNSHSGIRFPQNGCVSCPHLGLCLSNQRLIDANLTRRPGAAELDWLNDLDD
jgi:PD-(D/E)XK nuclease superfamily